jgi:hypothetical protein
MAQNFNDYPYNNNYQMYPMLATGLSTDFRQPAIVKKEDTNHTWREARATIIVNYKRGGESRKILFKVLRKSIFSLLKGRKKFIEKFFIEVKKEI